MHLTLQKLVSAGYLAPASEADTAGAPPVDRGDEVVSPLDVAGKEDMKEVEEKADEGLEEIEEDEEKDDEKAEEKDEEKEDKKKKIRIPKARFDEAIQKARQREKALLEEIERLKSAQKVSEVTKTIREMRDEIDKLQDKYEDLIFDGKKDEARTIRRQIEEMRDALLEYQANTKSEAARRAAIEEMSYNAALAGFEAKYPVINPEHEEFDEEKTNEVATLLNAFVKAGHNRVEALTKAVKYVLGESSKASKDPGLADKRTTDARKKAAEAYKKQPPDSKNIGLDSDKAGAKGSNIDVMRLSQEQFAKLDEETKARLRGDFV